MKKALFTLLFLSLGFNAFLLLSPTFYKQELINKSEVPVANENQYPFLSKRIFAENQNDILVNFVPLRTAMREYINNQKSEIGVYFEYLPSGSSIGINDQMEVRLASLIKIPIVMAVYKQIERKNLNKEELLTVKKDDINSLFGELWKEGEGTKISVDKAIELSLIKSDNTAARLLTRALPNGAIDEVFDSLDIPKDKVGILPVVSPKNYSSILRSLYLSSFLTKENSNEILEILSKTDFNDMLPYGISPKTKVSHKIGIFNQEDQEKIFSDCGIVFVPNRPHIICIMTKADEEESKEQIRHLSKMIYGYITSVN